MTIKAEAIAVLAVMVTMVLCMVFVDNGSALDAGNGRKPAFARLLEYDTIKSGWSEVVVEITLPDGGKVTRVTEPLSGRDGAEGGMRKLVGYRLPDGTVVRKDIRRNTDGTLTVQDVNDGSGNVDRHPKRMTEKEFVQWVKDQQGK